MRSHGRRYRRLIALVAALALLTAGLPATLQAGRDDWQEPARVIEEMDLEPGWTVADVGCGRGYFTFRLAEAVGEKGKVLAVDISEKALKALRGRVKKKDADNVEVKKSEPSDAKIPEKSADAALLCLVLHHASEDARKPLLKSIAKGLKPGGCLFVLDFRKEEDSPYHDTERLVARDRTVKLVKKAGLKLDAEYYYLEHQYFLRFRRPGGQD